ncbi:MAG TPA: hypothetical protein VN962_17445 [Polyangia bacterium]|nr:hypothetical protein [Polyangia bacterium]
MDRALAQRLGGGDAPRVIWADAGDEVLVLLDQLKVDVVRGAIAIVAPLQADDLPVEQVVTRFVLGLDAEGHLTGTTDASPLTGGPLAARWGAALQGALWGALVALIEHDRGQTPGARIAERLQPALRRGGQQP